METNFRVSGDYVIVKKTYFQKLQKSDEQYESRKEFSRNYMRKKYHEEKHKKEVLDRITEDDLFNSQIELLNFMNN